MPSIAEIRIGDVLPPLVKGPLTRQHLVEWCAAENDYYPVHYDEQFAQALGLAGTPVQGTLKYALLARVIERWLDPGDALLRIDAQYRGADFTGDTLTAHGRIAGISPCDAGGAEVTLEIWIENERGESTRGDSLPGDSLPGASLPGDSSTRGTALVRIAR